jgi:hypothetical protein
MGNGSSGGFIGASLAGRMEAEKDTSLAQEVVHETGVEVLTFNRSSNSGGVDLEDTLLDCEG